MCVFFLHPTFDPAFMFDVRCNIYQKKSAICYIYLLFSLSEYLVLNLLSSATLLVVLVFSFNCVCFLCLVFVVVVAHIEKKESFSTSQT